MNETEQFLKDTEIDQQSVDDVLTKPLTPEIEPEKEAIEVEFKAKNRRERRLLEQNQRLREEAIATNARLQGIAEAQKLREGTETAEFEKLVEPIWGTDTPEKAEATRILQKALRGAYEKAKLEAQEETLKVIDERRTSESQAVSEEEDNLDNILENLEDDYGVDLTSENSSTRKGFLTMLEKLSPKDQDGDIIEYADPKYVYEVYSQTRERNTRAKDLSSRSMSRGGTGTSNIQQDAQERFLKEAGII